MAAVVNVEPEAFRLELVGIDTSWIPAVRLIV